MLRQTRKSIPLPAGVPPSTRYVSADPIVSLRQECDLVIALPVADPDTVERNRRARQKRARLLKERRRHVAEAAENKSKKRVRKSSGLEGSSKKPKMDMHDAELFVDRIKVSRHIPVACEFC